ncbi:MAG: hypothetical protein WC595_01700 [Candidatus Nanoarchaeia archaeon]
MSAITRLSAYLVIKPVESPSQVYSEPIQIHSHTLYIPQGHLRISRDEIPAELPKELFERELEHLRTKSAIREVTVPADCLDVIAQLQSSLDLAKRCQEKQDIADATQGLSDAVQDLYTALDSQPN